VFGFVILAVWTVLYLHGLGEHPLRVWDESRYAVPARNMLTTGNWLDPQLQANTNTLSLDRNLRLVKPPLLYWLQATAMAVFGTTEFAARLPSALATLGMSGLVYRIGRRTYDRKAGLAGAITFLIFPGIYLGSHAGRAAVPDPTLALFGSLFVWLTWRGRQEPRLLLPAGIAAGLAVMTKGIAAGVFVFAVLPLSFSTIRTYLEEWRFTLAGITSTLLIALPWHCYAWLTHGQEFVDQYLMKAVVTRIEGDATVPGRPEVDIDGSSVGPEIEPVFDFMNYPYLKLALQTLLPPYEYALPLFLLAFLLALALVAWLARRDGRHRHRDKLALCWWALAVPLTFAVVGGNQPWYILPMYVPGLVLLGYLPAALFDGTLGELAASALARVGVTDPATTLRSISPRPRIRQWLAGISAPSEQVRTAGYVLCCVGVALLLVSSFVSFQPTPYDQEQRAIGQTIATEVPDKEPIYVWLAGDTWRRSLMSLSFYADRTYVAVLPEDLRSDERIGYAIVPIDRVDTLDVEHEVVATGPENRMLVVRFPDRVETTR
jgi:4-amino-4-deoxy-L-arabinose transferase-like glycosyltransferase